MILRAALPTETLIIYYSIIPDYKGPLMTIGVQKQMQNIHLIRFQGSSLMQTHSFAALVTVAGVTVSDCKFKEK